MTAVPEVMAQLKAQAEPGALEGMARFGMTTDRRLGVKMPEIRRLAKAIGRDHRLALKLWSTGVAEARILASLVADPAGLTANQIERWVVDFDSWDVCDQVCMNLFERSSLARGQIEDWAGRQEAFVKRAAFALIACLAWHDKYATDGEFEGYLHLIEAGATDERNFVKKAVSWALRTIGKRNSGLHRQAVRTARHLKASRSKPARWIGADALRELEGERVLARLAARG
jgi:3-methyladenine DNA glycosylase AlkD